MAEFQEVMKKWHRWCKMHPCSECQLSEICSFDPASRTDMEIATIEEMVMQWAAKHPEPVYPTWLEWLECNDIFHRTELSPNVYFTTVGKKAFDHIPVGIAKKLDIEPKGYIKEAEQNAIDD